MLRYYVLPQVWNYPEHMIFEQYGALLYCVVAVQQYVQQKIWHRRIEREDPILCPPSLLHLTPFDYFLWKYLKAFLFREPATTIEEHKSKIRPVIQTIYGNNLRNVFENMENRLGFVWREGRGHHEYLLH